MNKVALVGRITADPEIRSTQDGKSVANFTIAVDRRVARNANGEQQTADFIRCVAWEKRAEFAEKYLAKGIKIVLVGRLQTGSYKDRQTGKNVYTTDVVVEEMEFAESKGARQEAKQDTQQDTGFMDIPQDLGEELPFN